MTFFKHFFKKKAVKKLLSGGLIYQFDGNAYYIDSNNDIGIKKKKITVFRKEIRKIINNDFKIVNEETFLTDEEKNKIAFKVKKELENEGIEVEMTPSLPTNYQRHDDAR